MRSKPASCLPNWALEYFGEARDQFDDDKEMPHRREAFYRLLCTDDHDMRQMWERADASCHNEFDRRTFIGTLIYSTDDTTPDEKRPCYTSPSKVKEQRLRSPTQTLARKLARQLRDLQNVTPQRCAANKSRAKRLGSDIELLVIRYHFDLEPLDLNLTLRKVGIEYTETSKRGWIQYRRASDRIRAQAIDSARKLAQISDEKYSAWLVELADELDQLPSIKDEHGHQPEMRSNKISWGDWLRVAHAGLWGVGDSEDFLRHSDWAAIVHAIFDVIVTEERIGQAFRQGQ